MPRVRVGAIMAAQAMKKKKKQEEKKMKRKAGARDHVVKKAP